MRFFARKEGFLGYRTNKYKMNYYETASGVKFVLNTDLNVVGNPRDVLHQIYENVYKKFIILKST